VSENLRTAGELLASVIGAQYAPQLAEVLV